MISCKSYWLGMTTMAVLGSIKIWFSSISNLNIFLSNRYVELSETVFKY